MLLSDNEHIALGALQCKNSYFGPYAHPARKAKKA